MNYFLREPLDLGDTVEFVPKEIRMRNITTEGLPLIARGGQAEIYYYDKGKALRLARRPQDFDDIRYEFEVYRCLSASEVSVPRAYELVQVDGAPGIIMDRIAGDSMMSLVARKPFLAGFWAQELARLHLELGKVAASADIRPTRAKAEYCINKSQMLTGQTKQQIMQVLKELADGTVLCHGDFHPGNVYRGRT